jgi:hypothetical protein
VHPAEFGTARQFGGFVNNSFRVVIVLAAGLLIGAAAPVAAQSKGVDLTVGYQFQRLMCSGCDSTNIPAGFSADVGGTIVPMLSWVGQVDWGRKSQTVVSSDVTTTITFFGGGVRWSPMQSSGMSPYLQVLVGATRDAFSNNVPVLGNISGSETKFTFDVDGGVALPISSDNKTSLVAQVGYRRIAEDLALNDIRFVVGARFKLGG